MKRYLGATASIVIVLGACTKEDIVIAEIPNVGADGGIGVSGSAVRCTKSEDCPDQMYCERRGCDEPAGICVVPPNTCDNTEDPVCGCDGVTYFNDCLRRKNGASGSDDGECTTSFAACDGAAVGCPTNAYCARFVHYSTAPFCHGVRGRCWVIPDFCPPPARGDRWNLCSDDAVVGGETCVSTCRAIQEEAVFVEARACN